jgi:hypothetical protein
MLFLEGERPETSRRVILLLVLFPRVLFIQAVGLDRELEYPCSCRDINSLSQILVEEDPDSLHRDVNRA